MDKTWDSAVWFPISYEVKKRKVHNLCTAIKIACNVTIVWNYFKTLNTHFPANRALFSSRLLNTREKRPLLAGKTHTGRKEKPEIMLQFYLKGLDVLLYLDYNCLCLWLSMPARTKMDCNLKTAPTFSSLPPVCRHVVTNYMNNHFYVSWFPPVLLDILEMVSAVFT